MKKSLYFGILLAVGLYTQQIYALSVDSSLDLNSKTSVKDTESETKIDLEGDIVSTTSSLSNSTMATNIKGDIQVNRSDINESTDEDPIIGAESVNSQTDLAIYAKSLLKIDSNIDKVRFDENNIEVVYKRFGKVIGLIKVNYDIKVKITKDGNIEVDYPWYAALISDSNKRQVRERMENEISDLLDRNTNASGEIELNPSVKAKIANLVHTILVQELSAKASVKTDQNTSSPSANKY